MKIEPQTLNMIFVAGRGVLGLIILYCFLMAVMRAPWPKKKRIDYPRAWIPTVRYLTVLVVAGLVLGAVSQAGPRLSLDYRAPEPVRQVVPPYQPYQEGLSPEKSEAELRELDRQTDQRTLEKYGDEKD